MTSITIIASLFAHGAWTVACAFLVGLLGVSLGLFTNQGSEIGHHCYGKAHTPTGHAVEREEIRSWTRGTR